MSEPSAPRGPDFTAGVPIATVQDGVPLLGHAHGEAVVLVKRGAEMFAVRASRTFSADPEGH